jgi:hypothetical protein
MADVPTLEVVLFAAGGAALLAAGQTGFGIALALLGIALALLGNVNALIVRTAGTATAGRA